jgi:hypothetical protein
MFFHAVLPHLSWKFLPSGQLFAGEFANRTQAFDGDAWTDQTAIIDNFWQRHLLQTQYTDRLLGRLVNRLRKQGIYDKALFAVVADHGNSFEPRGQRRNVTSTNTADVGMVPFLVKAPGQRRGRISERFLQNIDVLPTVADLLGVKVPWRVDGQSAFKLRGKGRRRIVIAGDQPGRRVTTTANELLSQRRRTVARQARLFGSGRDLFRIGPRPALLGRRVTSMPRLPSGGTRAEIDLTGDYRSVDLRSRYVPALVTGKLTGPAKGVRQLAIVANGRIEATVRSYRGGGELLFAAMIPPSSLHQGRNRIQVFSIEGQRLRPLGSS